MVFAAGIALSRGGMGQLLELMFASMQGEVDKMFAGDVKPAEKAAFDAEMKRMRDSVRQNRVPLDRLQPLLRTLREATSDERITSAEAQQLTRELHAINTAPPPRKP